MKKIIYLIILLSLFAVGCGKDDTATNNQTENTQEEDNNGNSDENGDISNSGETSNNSDENDTSNGDGTTTEEGDTTKVEEIPFDLQIELPEGTTVGEYISDATVKGSDGWLLENSEYLTNRKFTELQDRMTWAITACGWIENIPCNGKVLADGGPVMGSEFCVEQKNGEIVNCGYFCEASFRVFSDSAIANNIIVPQFQNVDYWCIIYKKDATEFTWIFLNQEFFTKEQAMTVVQSLPATEEKIVVKTDFGYTMWVDQIEGYKIQYNTEYQQYQPFTLIKDGVERTMTLSYWSLEYVGKSYNELKEAEDYSEWGDPMATGDLLLYISGDVGVSIYEATDRIPVGDHVPEGARCYFVVWGHRKSSVIYTMVIDIGVEEDELQEIVGAIHIEFEEPEE